MTSFCNKVVLNGNNNMTLTEVINMPQSGNDDILTIVEIVCGILVAVMGLFAAYRCTWGRSADEVYAIELNFFIYNGCVL